MYSDRSIYSSGDIIQVLSSGAHYTSCTPNSARPLILCICEQVRAQCSICPWKSGKKGAKAEDAMNGGPIV